MMLYRKYIQSFFNCLFLLLISFIFQSCNLQQNISESQKLKEKFQKLKLEKKENLIVIFLLTIIVII